jgi:hypothetical protein
MAAADTDVAALVAACGEIVTHADAALASSAGYITITKDSDATALAAAAAALPALVAAADAAVELLEGE